MQVIGPLANAKANYALARQMERRMARIPGAVDVHMHQVVDVPELLFNVDRTRAQQMGLYAAGRGQQPAHFAFFQHADRAQLLDRSAQQRGLSGRGA